MNPGSPAAGSRAVAVATALSLIAALLPMMSLTLPAEAASTTLVINEIDYDQPGTDTAEFLEIKNVSEAPIDLDLYQVVMVNGTGGGAAPYRTFDLPAVQLAEGDYYVVCGNAATVLNCDLDVAPDTDLIQNGAPDAVAIVLAGAIVDTVSYEGNTGAPYTEGSGVGLEDVAAGIHHITRSAVDRGAVPEFDMHLPPDGKAHVV